MKKVMLLFGGLLGMASVASSQIRLTAQAPTCHVITASVQGIHAPDNGATTFVHWIERQLSSGVWESVEKRWGDKPAVDFTDLPAGVYRAACLMYGADKFGQTWYDPKIQSAVIRIGACAEVRADEGLTATLEPGSILIAPNPAKELLHIYLSSVQRSDDVWLDLYDGVGSLVLRSEVQSDDQKIDLSALASGLYLAQVRQYGQSIYQQKIMILNTK